MVKVHPSSAGSSGDNLNAIRGSVRDVEGHPTNVEAAGASNSARVAGKLKAVTIVDDVLIERTTQTKEDSAWVPIGADGMLFGGSVRKEHEVLQDLLVSRCRNPCDKHPSDSACVCDVPCRARRIIFWLDVSGIDFAAVHAELLLRARKLFDQHEIAHRGITLLRHEGGRFAKLSLLFTKEMDHEIVMNAPPHTYVVHLPGSVIGSAPRPLWNSTQYDASQVGHYGGAADHGAGAGADGASALVLVPRELPKSLNTSAGCMHTPYLDAAVSEEPSLGALPADHADQSWERRNRKLRHSHHIVIREKYGAKDEASNDEVPMYDMFRYCGGWRKMPDIVLFRFGAQEILSINEIDGTFSITLKVSLSWYDADFDTDEWRGLKQRKVRSHRAPYLTIRDVVSGTSTVGSVDNVCEVILRPTSNDPPGVVCFETELTCEIRDDNPITRFPFDRQELSIEFEMPGSSSKNHVDHGRVLLPVDVQIRAAHDLLTWNYHTMRAHAVSRRGHQQHVVVFCRVTRRYFSYLLNVMMIMFIIATLAFSAYAIPIQMVAERCGVTLTLMLTTVAFKLVLVEGMPKVSYLTFLDQYVIMSFFLIFIITIQNVVCASVFGVKHTVADPFLNPTFWWGSKLPFDLDDPTPEESYGLSKVVAAEEVWLVALLASWFSYNVLIAVVSMYYLYDNRQAFGATISKSKGRSVGGTGEASQNVLNHQALHLTGTLHRRKSIKHSGFEAHCKAVHELIRTERATGAYSHFCCECNACVLRATNVVDWSVVLKAEKEGGDTTSLLAHSGRSLASLSSWNRNGDSGSGGSGSGNVVAAGPMSEYLSLILNAGLASEMANLLPILKDNGLTSERLGEVDDGVIWELLASLNVAASSRLELIAAAKTRVDLLFLQGSASYLMIELGLEGKLIGKPQLLARVNNEIQTVCNSGKPVNLQFVANLVMASVLLNSSATPGMYLFAQRDCTSQEHPLFTQLWFGYVAHVAKVMFDTSLADQGDEWQRPGHVLVVDVGSGEFKPMLAEISPYGPPKHVEVKGLEKDKPNAVQYSKCMENLVSAFATRVARDPKLTPDAAWEKSQPILDAMVEKIKDSLVKCCDAITDGVGLCEADMHGTLVHFVGTSSTRHLLAGKDSEALGQMSSRVKGAVAGVIIRRIESALRRHFRDFNDVKYVVLLQKDEALYEYEAVNQVLHNAIDVPVEIQGGALSFGNLGWGNGSCQGMLRGPEHPSASEPLVLQVGLKVVQSIFRKAASEDARIQIESKLSSNGKTVSTIKFVSDVARGRGIHPCDYVESNYEDEELPFQREIDTIKKRLQQKMAMDGAKIKFNSTASDESVEYTIHRHDYHH